MSSYIVDGRPRTKKEEKESQILTLICFVLIPIAFTIFFFWAVLF